MPGWAAAGQSSPAAAISARAAAIRAASPAWVGPGELPAARAAASPLWAPARAAAAVASVMQVPLTTCVSPSISPPAFLRGHGVQWHVGQHELRVSLNIT